MTEPQEIISDYLIKELKEQHNEQMNAVLIHPEVYKYLTRKSHKKIKRRLFYEVIWWVLNEEWYKMNNKMYAYTGCVEPYAFCLEPYEADDLNFMRN